MYKPCAFFSEHCNVPVLGVLSANVSNSLNQPPIQINSAAFTEITAEYILALFTHQRQATNASGFMQLLQAPGYRNTGKRARLTN